VSGRAENRVERAWQKTMERERSGEGVYNRSGFFAAVFSIVFAMSYFYVWHVGSLWLHCSSYLSSCIKSACMQ